MGKGFTCPAENCRKPITGNDWRFCPACGQWLDPDEYRFLHDVPEDEKAAEEPQESREAWLERQREKFQQMERDHNEAEKHLHGKIDELQKRVYKLELDQDAKRFEARHAEEMTNHVAAHEAYLLSPIEMLTKWFYELATRVKELEAAWNGDAARTGMKTAIAVLCDEQVSSIVVIRKIEDLQKLVDVLMGQFPLNDRFTCADCGKRFSIPGPCPFCGYVNEPPKVTIRVDKDGMLIGITNESPNKVDFTVIRNM